MAEVQPPFSAEALNRWRMTHSDRDIRPLIRRLNAAGVVVEGEPPEEGEAEWLHLEIEKWRLNVERMMASTRAMERQKREHERKRDETIARTEALRAKLEAETELLHAKQLERSRRMKCDEVARKITARGKTRKELDALIESMQALIEDHRRSYESVLGVAQQRADSFSRIAALVDECRALKLPLSEEDAAAEKLVEQAEKELKAEKQAEKAAAEKSKLSAQTLPFQPSGKPALSAPASRQHSASPGPSAQGHAHPLPARPARSGARSGRGAGANHTALGPSGLPPRPVSGLRNVRHMHAPGPGGLEDGELGEDDGSSGTKRKAPAEDAGHGGRSTRRK